MYKLIIFILINAGFAIGITGSTLTEPFRAYVASRSSFFGKLFTCPMCFGFWSSLAVYPYVYRTINGKVIGFMFIGSLTPWFLRKITN